MELSKKQLMFKMVASNHKNKRDIVDDKDQLPMLRKIMKRGADDSTSIDYNAANCLRKINSLINTLNSFNMDTFIYSPYKEDLVNVINDRHSTILRLVGENAELMRHISALDRSHAYRKRKRLELNKAPVCTIQVIDISDDTCNNVIKGGLQQNIPPIEADSWVSPGCDFTIVNFEDITPSSAEQQLELETIISNAVDSLDANSESESNAHSSDFNICEKLLSGNYVCEENYLDSLAYEVNMIGGSDTPIILDSWLNEVAKDITTPCNVIELKAIK